MWKPNGHRWLGPEHCPAACLPVCGMLLSARTAAVCPCRIRIHDLQEVKDVYNMINVEEEKGTVAGLQWTPDGQLLTVSTNQGVQHTHTHTLYASMLRMRTDVSW